MGLFVPIVGTRKVGVAETASPGRPFVVSRLQYLEPRLVRLILHLRRDISDPLEPERLEGSLPHCLGRDSQRHSYFSPTYNTWKTQHPHRVYSLRASGDRRKTSTERVMRKEECRDGHGSVGRDKKRPIRYSTITDCYRKRKIIPRSTE